ncbi:hypothetical protein [Halovenus sp. HT40]|uniref:hypothetical protein n=1 Tax=Halovenus sp. HT40 TaxID=3126691 RepID=UPI00300F1DAD
MVLKEFAEFLKRANGDEVAYLQRGDEDIWVYALPKLKYTFHFSIQSEDGEVKKIQARNLDWIDKHVAVFEYVEPPTVVSDTVEERVELVEDPDALAVLKDTCVRCQEEYLVDVTPKIDLLIDGYYAQRMIEEYCPDCGQPLIQRSTFHPPKQYQEEFQQEEIDISEYTWKHARR